MNTDSEIAIWTTFKKTMRKKICIANSGAEMKDFKMERGKGVGWVALERAGKKEAEVGERLNKLQRKRNKEDFWRCGLFWNENVRNFLTSWLHLLAEFRQLDYGVCLCNVLGALSRNFFCLTLFTATSPPSTDLIGNKITARHTSVAPSIEWNRWKWFTRENGRFQLNHIPAFITNRHPAHHHL